MLITAEGGKGLISPEGVLTEAARTTAERTKVALRAGLERLRQVREKGDPEKKPESLPGSRRWPLQRESSRTGKALQGVDPLPIGDS